MSLQVVRGQRRPDPDARSDVVGRFNLIAAHLHDHPVGQRAGAFKATQSQFCGGIPHIPGHRSL